MALNGPIVITGTTHGIGTVTARELARAGRPLVMLVRDMAAGAAVARAIVASVPGARVDVVGCDLASLASVRDAAAQVLDRCESIACLVNNAGIVSMRRAASADGFELVFATNHLGPFLLTAMLLPRMPSGSRVVNVASRIHRRASLDLGQVEDPESTPYRAQAAYAQSKLANVLHAFALARRVAARGISANCLHPGVIRSNLLPGWLRIVKPWISPGMFDVERGAQASLALALDPAMQPISGAYFDEHARPTAASALARSTALQEALWSASCRWVGLDDEKVIAPGEGSQAGTTIIG